MIPSSLSSSGFRIKPKVNPRDRTTAFYLFDPTQKHVYDIDNIHFIAKNRRFNAPTVTTGAVEDMDRISAEMITTTGTIMEMVDQYMDGATISVEPDVAERIYKRILDHFNEHFRAMRQDKMYEAPPTDDFRYMAEFATGIRPWAMKSNPMLESKQTTQLQSFLAPRATFSQAIVEEVKQNVIPKSVMMMDNIERYLENLHGG